MYVSDAKSVLGVRASLDLVLARLFDEIEVVDDMPVCAAFERVVVVDLRVQGRGSAGRARKLAEMLVELGANCC